MSAFEVLSAKQKLRASVHRDSRLICNETCHLLGLDVTKEATEVIAELVYKKLAVYGADLEAFAKHAKRQTINAEDVKLLVRRNPSLLTHLNKQQPSAGNTTKDKRRKTATPVTKQTKEKEKNKENSSVAQQTLDTKDIAANNAMEVEDNLIDLTFD